MSSTLPEGDSSGISEGLLRVTGSLALWMHALTVPGLLIAIVPMLLLLRQERVGWESLGTLIGGVISCVVWVFFWHCAGSFRRIAKGRQVGSHSLADALGNLRTFFCMLTILTVIVCGAALALGALRPSGAEYRLSDAARQQIVDDVRKALRQSAE